MFTMDLHRNGALYFYINVPKNDRPIMLHSENCKEISNPLHRKYVGLFYSQRFALEKLKAEYPKIKVCRQCLDED